MKTLFHNIYQDKTILLTGNTGFKGSWLALWLESLGARVIGLSKDVPSSPAHVELLGLDYPNIRGDICNAAQVAEVFQTYQPDLVFHLAAQALVRYSYQHPLETLSTNILGTAILLDEARKHESVKGFVSVTSDKAYENKEWVWGYREDDPMGGFDPYSASKGCAELITASYRNSFYQHANKLLASVRAGNVIGGGDWALDRLVPDIFKAAARGESVNIRHMEATRPWQHVLEPLSGYLLVGQHLLEGDQRFAEAWNFGPTDEDVRTVGDVVKAISACWDAVHHQKTEAHGKLHEANLLKLDCSKARAKLKWQPVWRFEQTIRYTADWYKDYYSQPGLNIYQRSIRDLQAYIEDAKAKALIWTQ